MVVVDVRVAIDDIHRVIRPRQVQGSIGRVSFLQHLIQNPRRPILPAESKGKREGEAERAEGYLEPGNECLAADVKLFQCNGNGKKENGPLCDDAEKFRPHQSNIVQIGAGDSSDTLMLMLPKA